LALPSFAPTLSAAPFDSNSSQLSFALRRSLVELVVFSVSVAFATSAVSRGSSTPLAPASLAARLSLFLRLRCDERPSFGSFDAGVDVDVATTSLVLVFVAASAPTPAAA
jgi:hypothetical protein